jgi:hypothetical protein
VTNYDVYNRGNLKFQRCLYHFSVNSIQIIQWNYDFIARDWPPLIYVLPPFSGNFAEGRIRKVRGSLCDIDSRWQQRWGVLFFPNFSSFYTALPTDMSFTFVNLPHICLLLVDILGSIAILWHLCAGVMCTQRGVHKGLNFVK